MYKGEGFKGFFVKCDKKSKYLILSINKETLWLKVGVMVIFERGF